MKSLPGVRPASGDGLFGEASGKQPEAFSVENQPSPEAKAAGREVAAEVRERIAAKKNEIVDRLLKTAIDSKNDGASNQAGMYLINQIAGTPAQSVDLTTAGGPMAVVIRRFVEDVPE